MLEINSILVILLLILAIALTLIDKYSKRKTMEGYELPYTGEEVEQFFNGEQQQDLDITNLQQAVNNHGSAISQLQSDKADTVALVLPAGTTPNSEGQKYIDDIRAQLKHATFFDSQGNTLSVYSPDSTHVVIVRLMGDTDGGVATRVWVVDPDTITVTNPQDASTTKIDDLSDIFSIDSPWGTEGAVELSDEQYARVNAVWNGEKIGIINGRLAYKGVYSLAISTKPVQYCLQVFDYSNLIFSGNGIRIHRFYQGTRQLGPDRTKWFSYECTIIPKKIDYDLTNLVAADTTSAVQGSFYSTYNAIDSQTISEYIQSYMPRLFILTGTAADISVTFNAAYTYREGSLHRVILSGCDGTYSYIFNYTIGQGVLELSQIKALNS